MRNFRFGALSHLPFIARMDSELPLQALIDCNNFYVSCERLFNPKWIGKPVVVLSNNDGCIISRSQEAKVLGIPMGAPHYQWKDFMDRHGVIACSSNYSLYGDLSHRVMNVLSQFHPDLEIYSIDEAFFPLHKLEDPLGHCHRLKKIILQWTGIPTSIGIAPTKTLAKAANHIAKRNPKWKGIFYFSDSAKITHYLEEFPTHDVWGIGWRIAQSLKRKGIQTAAQFRKQDDEWIRHYFSVTGLRTAWELRGIPSISLEESSESKKSIMTSRSFGRHLTDQGELEHAIAAFAARGGEKLREEKSLAGWLQVFILTSPHKEEDFYQNQMLLFFPQPTDYTPDLIRLAQSGLKKIFRPGYSYKRAGILLGGLVPASQFQQDLFIEQDVIKEDKQKKIMKLLDEANQHFGYPILYFAQEAREPSWRVRRLPRSPFYTTRWEDLLIIEI
jgi:DNA polymerase V